MTYHSRESSSAESISAQWINEAAYHFARAKQERRLSDLSVIPEAKNAHSILACRHLALAGAAQKVADMPDAHPVHPSTFNEMSALLQDYLEDNNPH